MGRTLEIIPISVRSEVVTVLYPIGLLTLNIPSVLPTYHPDIKEAEEDPGYKSKVSAAPASNINGSGINNPPCKELLHIPHTTPWRTMQGQGQPCRHLA
jgi:hypothetical protein